MLTVRLSGVTTFISQITGWGREIQITCTSFSHMWRVMKIIKYPIIMFRRSPFQVNHRPFSKVNQTRLNSLAGINYASEMSEKLNVSLKKTTFLPSWPCTGEEQSRWTTQTISSASPYRLSFCDSSIHCARSWTHLRFLIRYVLYPLFP